MNIDWTSVYLQNQNGFGQFGNMFNQMNNPMIVNNPFNQIIMGMGMQQNNGSLLDGGNQTQNQNNFVFPEADEDYKINVCFTTSVGTKINMVFDCKETVDNMLKKFLKRVNLENLVGQVGDKIKFILSADSIKFGDNRKLKEVFEHGITLGNVYVHDTQNLIGAYS